MEALKSNSEQTRLLYLRDNKGKSALHLAIEKQNFEIALYLLEKFPLLAKMNDCVYYLLIELNSKYQNIRIIVLFQTEKYPIDYLRQIDPATLEEADAELFDNLFQKLN